MSVELDDAALWAAFHDRTLSHAAWNHTAHLRVAWMHLHRHDVDAAHVLMRVGIIRLNHAHGLIETAERGYHETLTRVWLVLVADARRRHRTVDSRTFVTTHPLARDAPLAHYTREYLFSLAARARFLPPDLTPLPE